MAEKRDYYDVLGLNKSASADDIKNAYKRLAKQFHPDVSSDPKAKEKFQEVLEAYTILSDQQKRSNYDQFGHAAEGFSGYRPGGFEGFGGGIDFDFSELFNNFAGFGFEDFGFGGQQRRQRWQKGSNLRVDLQVSFEEAAFGVTKSIEIDRIETCDECSGTGAKGGHVETCKTCRGHGVVQQTRRLPFGVFSTQSTCPDCKGAGKTASEKCGHCRGTGTRKVRKKVDLKIPAGIETGMHLRLAEMGNAGSEGGGFGDLFVIVFVEKHEFFKRDGGDIFCEIPVSFASAALGTDVSVATLKGSATVKIPAGTQTGTIFRLKGKGVKNLETGKIGDQFVKVLLATPTHLSAEQKRILEQFEKLDGIPKDKKGFFGKIGL